MGRVYLGESPGGRLVAIKVMRPEHAIDPEFLMRFKREVAAARLVGGYHTAQVIDADPEAEAPWMVTAYISGPALHSRVDQDGPLSPEELRRLAAGLAEGLTAIHAAGLVHRDLKPGNVLMADDGPRIIDFGLSRPTGADAISVTMTGKLLGTLAFMSPEQVNGDVAGPASDVFSLGGVLLYAASGHTPFGSASLGATSFAILHDEPDLGPVSEPLRDIVRSCLAKDPQARPAPAALLAALAGLPRPLPSQRFLPPERTIPPETGSAPPGGLSARIPRLASTRGLAERILRPYRFPAPKPQTAPAADASAGPGAGGAPGAPGGTRRLPRRTPREPAAEQRPAAGIHAVGVPATSVQVRPATDGWTVLAGDPGGQWIASADADGTIALWDAGTGMPIRSWPTGRGIRALAGGPENLLAVVADDSVIHLWDAWDGTERAAFSCGTGRIDALTFAPARTAASRDFGAAGDAGPGGVGPGGGVGLGSVAGAGGGTGPESPAGLDGLRLTTGGPDGIQLWDIPLSSPPVLTAEFQCGFRVTSISYGASDAILAAGSANGRVLAWDLTLAKRDLWPTPVDATVDGLYTYAGAVLAVAWDATAGKWVSVGSDGPNGGFQAAAVLGSTATTAVAEAGTGRIRVFLNGKPERSWYLRGMDTPMRGVGALSLRDGILMTGPAGVTHFWDRPRRRMQRPEGVRAAAARLAVSADESMLALSDDQHGLGVFDIADGLVTQRWWRQCEGTVTALSFTPDGKRLATAGDSVRGWNTGNGGTLRSPRGGAGSTRALAYDQSGRRLAAAGEDGTIPLWEGQRLRRTLTGHQGPVLAVAFGPAGGDLDGLLITAGSDNTIRVWDTVTGQETRCLTGLGYQVRTLVASDTCVAVGGADGGVRLYSPEHLHAGPSPSAAQAQPAGQAWADVPVLRGHVHAITAMSFAGNGQRLVTGGRDGTAWCWDLATRQATLVLAPRADGWAAAETRADGSWQGYGDPDGWIWHADGLARKPL
jgi:WD40 repeat protein